VVRRFILAGAIVLVAATAAAWYYTASDDTLVRVGTKQAEVEKTWGLPLDGCFYDGRRQSVFYRRGPDLFGRVQQLTVGLDDNGRVSEIDVETLPNAPLG
jgi:hypothetical protein